MRSFLTVAVAVALCAAVAQAEMVLYEDFESYTVDATIHLQGTDTTAAWGEVARWYCQDNTSILRDHTWSNVRLAGGNKYLEMVANNLAGGQSTVCNAMSMESMEIDAAAVGTIYMRFAVNDVSSNMLCTNDLEPGWDYNSYALVDPGVIGADGWQEGANNEGYTSMAALFKQGGGIPFGARDQAMGNYFDDPDIQLPIKKWMELWIQVDAPGDRTKYFVCEQGGTPVQAMAPGPDGLNNTADDTEWWGMRNQTYNSNGVENLKWIPSNYGYDDEISNTIYVDTIGIDQTAMTLDRVGPDAPDLPEWAPAIPGDLDGDGDVDLDDFVILKTNFGMGPGGDCDGDGDTDLDDFVILKTNFGT